jgi:hypothetical protein
MLSGLVLGYIVALTQSFAQDTMVTQASRGASQEAIQVFDWQKLVNTMLGAAGLIGVLLVFVNQRLTAREARRASQQADNAQGTAQLINSLTSRLERAEDRGDKLSREITEIRLRYEEHLDKLETELSAERVKYEELRQQRHAERQEYQDTLLTHERERGEWQLRIQELEHSLAEEKKLTATLLEKVTYLEKCIGQPGQSPGANAQQGHTYSGGE